jgi:hypothetical protein
MEHVDPVPVIELRVHGVAGTPPNAMLGDAFPEQVDGDDVAQFLRARADHKGADSRVTVEAFYWGRFTSGSPSRALWLLLAPFALLNLSRYALLLPRGPHRPRSIRVADGVLRLLGLTLTLMLVVNVAFVSLNVLIFQCAGAAQCARETPWLSWMAGWPPGAQLLIGALPCLLVITMLWWFGRQTFLYEPRGNRPDLSGRDRNGRLGDRAFWHASPQAAPLRALHVGASCAVLGMLVTGFLGEEVVGPVPWVRWTLLGTGAIAAAAAACLAVLVPLLERSGPGVHDTVEVHPAVTVTKWMCTAYLVVTVAVVASLSWSAGPPHPVGVRGSEPMPGFETAANVGGLTAALLLVALSVCSVVIRLQASGRDAFRDGLRSLPPAFRPLFRGFGALALATSALLLAGGFSSGLAFWAADLVGEPVVDGSAPALIPDSLGRTPWGVELGTSYWTGAALWGLATIVFVLVLPALMTRLLRLGAGTTFAFAVAAVLVAVAVAGFAVADPAVGWGGVAAAAGTSVIGGWRWVREWRTDGLPAAVAADYPSRQGDRLAPRGLGKVLLRWRSASGRYHYHLVFGAIALLGAVAVVVGGGLGSLVPVRPSLSPVEQGALTAISGFGTAVVTALAGSLLTLGLRSWSNPTLRTTAGILWDLLAFWPRQSHPICPPPYGGRATLELAERAKVLAGGSWPRTVVLSGHSQGGLLCAAAIEVLAEEAGGRPESRARRTLDRLCLVSHGSQLQWAYARLFPAFIGFVQLGVLYRDHLGGRWRNLYRWTDPLGGPVLAWPPDALPGPATREWVTIGDPGAPAVPARRREDGAWAAGSDIRLPDPDRVVRAPGKPLSPLRGHGYYVDDPVYSAVVVDLAGTVPEADPGRPAAALPIRDVDPPVWKERRLLRFQPLKVLVVIAAFALSFGAAVTALDDWRMWLAPGTFAIGVAVLLIVTDDDEFVRPHPPMRAILRTVAAEVIFPGLAALLTLGAGGLTYVVAGLFGSADTSSTWAWWATTVAGSILAAVAVTAVIEDTRVTLFRTASGVPAAAEPPVDAARRTWIAGIAVQIVVLVAALVAAASWPAAQPWIAVIALAAMVIAAAIQLSEVPAPDAGTQQLLAPVIQACEEVLTEAGYEVIRRPGTGDPTIDPLLDVAHLIAQRPDRALLISARGPEPGDQPTSWRAASPILVAARAVQKYTGSDAARDVVPVLVLVDTIADGSLEVLAERESVQLVVVDTHGAEEGDLTTQLAALAATTPERPARVEA